VVERGDGLSLKTGGEGGRERKGAEDGRRAELELLKLRARWEWEER
jgi:hypothetical protein